MKRDIKVKDDYLSSVLAGEAPLLFDGAMGTMVQRRSLIEPGKLPDLLCLTDASAVTEVHAAYVEAGSQVVTTNTFGANELRLAGAASVADVYEAAVACARAAGARYVAADIGPSGEMLDPYGDLEYDEAYDLFAAQAAAAQAAGADLVIVETMTDLNEMRAAASAALENTALPVFATMTFTEHGRTLMGDAPADATRALDELGVDALGVNCSLGPDALAPIVAQMQSATEKPVIVQANAGLPSVVDGQTVYNIGPAEYAAAVKAMVDAGVRIVGGCCGTDPAYISALAAILL